MAASGIITDVDQFTEPVRAPADGDPANGETFEAGLQDLANRTRNLKNRVDGHDAAIGDLESSRVIAGSALYAVDAVALDPLTPAPLTQVAADDGYVLDGNEVTVPAPGVYLASLSLIMRSSSVAGNARLAMAVLVDDDPAFYAYATRVSDNPDTDVGCSGSGLIFISDPSTQKISVQFVASGNSVTVGSIGSVPGFSAVQRLSIARVSA